MIFDVVLAAVLALAFAMGFWWLDRRMHKVEKAQMEWKLGAHERLMLALSEWLPKLAADVAHLKRETSGVTFKWETDGTNNNDGISQ